MRIVDIRETAIPLKSSLANSSFDFSEMTTSVVAVITDVVRDGKPVAGFAFNSTGRYACGAQMRERFIPRIRAARPESLLDGDGNLDPEKILACMMQREKAGGHSERSIAIGTIEVAVWDAVAKIAGKPLHAPAGGALQRRQASPDKVFCYVGGGWYWPGQTIRDLQDEMRRHLDAGYTMVKMKVGGLPLADDVEARRGGEEHPAAARASSRSTPTASSAATRRSPMRRRWRRSGCAGSRSRAIRSTSRCWRRSPASMPAPLSTGENLFSTPDVENLVRFGGLKRARRDVIQIDPPQAYGIAQYARTLAMLARHEWPRGLLFPHGGNQMSLAIAAGFGLGGAESYPGVFGDFGGFADDAKIEDGFITLSDRPGIGFEGQAALYRIMRELAGGLGKGLGSTAINKRI